MKSAIETLYWHSQKYLTGVSHISVQVLVIFAVNGRYVSAKMLELIVGESEKQVPEFQMISIAFGAKRHKPIGCLFQDSVHKPSFKLSQRSCYLRYLSIPISCGIDSG